MDLVVKSPRIPVVGETILGEGFLMTPGGKGANQAVAAARLGANVHLVAKLGEDIFADQSLENFKKVGVNTEYVLRTPKAPSGVALITVDDQGANVIVVAPGANSQLSPEDVQAAESVIASADVLILQLEVPMKTVEFAASMAHDRNVPVILDPAPAQELDWDLLAKIDVITPNETEAQIITGVEVTDIDSARAACQSLLERNVRAVALTMGEKGFLAACDQGLEFVPAVRVEAIDTTAAGDAFTAALAFGIAQGQTFLEAAENAKYIAALSTTKMGAQSSMPTLAQAEKFKKKCTQGEKNE